MKTTVRALGAIAMTLLAACSADQSHMNDPGPHGPQCPAIQTANGIHLSSERAAALRKIAGAPDLSEHEQMFIVDAAMKSGFSTDRADVLVALARNPSTTSKTRSYIAQQAEYSGMFSSDQARVSEALAGPDRR